MPEMSILVFVAMTNFWWALRRGTLFKARGPAAHNREVEMLYQKRLWKLPSRLTISHPYRWRAGDHSRAASGIPHAGGRDGSMNFNNSSFGSRVVITHTTNLISAINISEQLFKCSLWIPLDSISWLKHWGQLLLKVCRRSDAAPTRLWTFWVGGRDNAVLLMVCL